MKTPGIRESQPLGRGFFTTGHITLLWNSDRDSTQRDLRIVFTRAFWRRRGHGNRGGKGCRHRKGFGKQPVGEGILAGLGVVLMGTSCVI